VSKKRAGPAGTRLDVTNEELEALLERVRVPLGEAGYQKLQAAIRTPVYVTELLETRQATLERLRRLLCHSSTEKTGKVLKQAGMEAGDQKHKPPGDTQRIRPVDMGATAPRPIGARARSRFRTHR